MLTVTERERIAYITNDPSHPWIVQALEATEYTAALCDIRDALPSWSQCRGLVDNVGLLREYLTDSETGDLRDDIDDRIEGLLLDLKYEAESIAAGIKDAYAALRRAENLID